LVFAQTKEGFRSYQKMFPIHLNHARVSWYCNAGANGAWILLVRRQEGHLVVHKNSPKQFHRTQLFGTWPKPGWTLNKFAKEMAESNSRSGSISHWTIIASGGCHHRQTTTVIQSVTRTHMHTHTRMEWMVMSVSVCKESSPGFAGMAADVTRPRWLRGPAVEHRSLANSAFHPFGVDKWLVSCNWVSAAAVAVVVTSGERSRRKGRRGVICR